MIEWMIDWLRLINSNWTFQWSESVYSSSVTCSRCIAEQADLNLILLLIYEGSRLMTKPTKWHVHPSKRQISLGIRPVGSKSSLCAQWVPKGTSFLHADSEVSDQTGWMPSLIWVFAGRTCHFVGFVIRRLRTICLVTLLTQYL